MVSTCWGSSSNSPPIPFKTPLKVIPIQCRMLWLFVKKNKIKVRRKKKRKFIVKKKKTKLNNKNKSINFLWTKGRQRNFSKNYISLFLNLNIEYQTMLRT